jgi:creatinine amidohydrolase/Fe(II)-dependent formamide hydrolase-like protein
MFTRIPVCISRAAIALMMLLVGGLVLPPVAAATTPATVFLEELTWTELRDQVQAGKSTILVPIGGTEQSGPHIALGKHNARAKALSEKIAVALGNALVAPVIAYVPEGSINPPTQHMKFPGTITVPAETFEKLLESAARSFRAAGFRDIVFLGDHGGYQKNEKQVADRLNRDWGATPTRAHAVDEYYRATETDFVEALKRRGYREDEIGTHAALADTSLTLALDPGMVRLDRLRSGPAPGPADGVYGGDPRRSSAELGQLGVEAIVGRTVAAIKKEVARR